MELPTMLPVFRHDSFKSLAYSVVISAFSGIGYTFISEMLSKTGFCEEGGIGVRKIKEEREKRGGYSWFNTIIKR